MVEVVEQAGREGLIADQIVGRIRRFEREVVSPVEPDETVVHFAGDDAEEGEPEPPTLLERIKAAGSHAALHDLARELGIEVPDNAKDAWGDIAKVADKQALLVEKASAASEPTE